jgi:hypothetical protein
MRIDACAALRFQLCQRGAGFIEIFASLFRVNARHQLNLLHLELGFAERALCRLYLGFILGTRRRLSRLRLKHFAVLVVALGLLVDRVA